MGYKDLREFLERVDSFGELRRVEGADWDLEIGAITEVAASSPGCPLLLFDKVRGYRPGYRIVTNLLHTERRLALALGESPDLRGVGLIKKWKEGPAKVTEGPPPVEVNHGPLRENILSGKNVNVMEFPAVKWHELDGGRYFAGPVTIARDPDEGWVNLGIFRLQVHDKSTLSLYIGPGSKHTKQILQKYWDRGESCPVAISMGHTPALFIAAALFSPWGLSEYELAGQLNGMPIKVVPGELTGLPVPASAEVVLEGEVPSLEVESHAEGPFGEATGYYVSGLSTKEPVIKVKSIMHRNNPIIQGAPPMRPLPGLWHFPVNHRCATVWSDLEKCGIPDIQGVWQEGYGLMVISLKQRYAGHAKQAGQIAAGSRGSTLVRFIVTVDQDIDPCNVTEVMWAMATRCDPERDIEIIKEVASSSIDPLLSPEQRERADIITGKVIINACTPIYRNRAFPPVVAVSAELKAEIIKKWWNVIK
ncbi:MAG: UbiD family decarboxylase [Deltaproteobacteria bacterium]|nr:MAG: UbiD family decarboxylase [Deltaproteobacteria bacterium]